MPVCMFIVLKLLYIRVTTANDEQQLGYCMYRHALMHSITTLRKKVLTVQASA